MTGNTFLHKVAQRIWDDADRKRREQQRYVLEGRDVPVVLASLTATIEAQQQEIERLKAEHDELKEELKKWHCWND